MTHDTRTLALAEWSMSSTNVVHCGDALATLRRMPSNFVHCIVTSPPYFGLRDYGVAGQIGLEDTPREFVDKLVMLFREARRVLRDDGTCWINLGDSYISAKSRYSSRGQTIRSQAINGGYAGEPMDGKKPDLYLYGYKDKDLAMIPHRTAIALQDDGWWVRSDIIWHKPNPMPESVNDRPTKSHEYVFLLAKSERYFYDADAIREKLEPSTIQRDRTPRGRRQNGGGSEISLRGIEYTQELGNMQSNEAGRNKRSVWTVPTQPNPVAHFATFPQKLIEPMILAGCPLTVCAACGAGYVRIVGRTPGPITRSGVTIRICCIKNSPLPALPCRVVSCRRL